jgi:dsDNA-binding SOS-regulon protein
MYADDTQLYVSFKPKDYKDKMLKLEACIREIRRWMEQNPLKLNDAKTEFLVLGNQNRLSTTGHITSLSVGNSTVKEVKSAKNIGAILDSNLTLRDHLDGLCRACYLHLNNIVQVRPFLTQDATATLVRSLITSKLDYVNSILYGLPDYMIRKLQLVQNNAARLVFRKRKHEHVTPLLKSLHWLPVEQRISYKINLLTFKALHGQAPSYLRELITEYKPTRHLRSNSKGLLQEKKARLKKGGDRAFSVCAPKLWNRLPSHVINCDTLDGFKSSLKTHYFNVAFP